MRVCVIGPAPPLRGGIAQHTMLLCRHLSVKHEVRCITFSRLYPSILFPGRSQVSGAYAFPAEPSIDTLSPFTWTRTAEHLREYRPDIVIVQWWHPFFAACISAILGRAHPRRTIFICHNILPHEPLPFSQYLAARALRRGDGYLVHSNAQAELVRSIAPGKPVRRIPLPMFDAFPKRGIARESARGELGVSGRTLLFFGMVRRYKGLETLIRALPGLKDMNINCMVAGEFYGGIARYRREMERLHVADSFKITDRYIPDEEVELYFAAADAVVLPYTSATQSGIVQLAYGFGRPVIASAVGGLPEVVRHRETGLLVPPGDAGKLAQAVRAFYAEDMAEEFAEHVKRESGRISWKTVLQEIDALAAAPQNSGGRRL